MPDNINVTPGVGATVAADEIAGALHQRVKLTLGNDGVNNGDVSETNPMPSKSERSSSTTISSVTNQTSSGIALAANANRKGFIIHNDSTTTVFLAFGATASAAAFTVRLTSQATYILNSGAIYTGDVSRIAQAANGSLRITELL